MAGSLGTVFGQVRLDVRQAVAAYAALRAQNARTVYAMRGSGQAFQTAGQTMALAGVGLVAVFAKAVTAAAEFERQMDFFGAVSDTTGAKLQAVGDHALDVAEKTIYSANEIAEGYIELGKAGVSAEQIINGIGEAMANLGAAGDIPLAESGQIITSTIQQFDMAARDAVEVTDLLAGAANASIADITDLGVSLKYVGGVAHTAGLDFEDTLTAISLLAEAGIRGSTAGTSLRQMIVSFGGATEPARDALQKLGILTENGANKFYDMQGNLKPLSQVFEILGRATEDLTAKQRVQLMRTIFNNRALSAAAILSREGAKGFREMNAAMSKTTAAEVASARLDNLSGDIEILQGNIETLFIRAGTPFQEFMRGIVQAITRMVQAFGDLPPETQKLIFSIIGISGVALILMGVLSMLIGQLLLFGAFFSRFGAAFGFFGRLLGAAGKGVLKFLGIWQLFSALFRGIGRVIMMVASPIGRLIAAFSRLGVIGWVIRGVMVAIGAVIGAVSAPVLIVIGVIAALVAAFVILWNKSEGFRNFWINLWNSVVSGVQSAWGWLQTLPGRFSAMWSSIVSGVGNLVSGIVNWFQQLPGRVAAFASQMVSRVASFFSQLPGRVSGFVQSMVQRVISFFQQLPGRVGFIIGFMVGRVVRTFIQMGIATGAAVAALVQRVISFFQQLPGRIASFMIQMAARAIAAAQRLRTGIANAAQATVTAVVNFFQALPGRIASFFINAAAMAISAAQRLRSGVVAAASAAVSGMVNFFSSLPGRIIGFFTSLATGSIAALNNLVSAAANIGSQIYNGIIGAIQSLPGAVAGIIGEVIAAFQNAASAAASAVKDFGAGVVSGFKAGLGIGSPSYLERAMWQIRDNVQKSAEDLAKTTLGVQRLSETMGRNQVVFPKTVEQYASLARSTQAAEARRQYMSTAGGGAAGAGGKTVHKEIKIDMPIHNPKAEKPSDTAVKRLNRVAQLGLLDGGDD